MRRRWGYRGWAIVWAALQFALPVAATYADAGLERDGGVAQASHVESSSDSSCRPVHPAECALCQVVSRAFAPTAHDASCHAIVRVVEQPAVAGRPARALAGAARLSLARAPPLG